MKKSIYERLISYLNSLFWSNNKNTVNALTNEIRNSFIDLLILESLYRQATNEELAKFCNIVYTYLDSEYKKETLLQLPSLKLISNGKGFEVVLKYPHTISLQFYPTDYCSTSTYKGVN